MDLKGSRTEANLMTAFSGECMARVKYELYAARVKNAGFIHYGDVIDFISSNEKEHAELWLKALEGDTPSVTDVLSDSEEGELYEFETMYTTFAEEAEREGFAEIARLFREVGEIEKNHARIYLEMRENIENGTVFSGEDSGCWICLKCGNRFCGERPPEICPVCGHDKSYRKKDCKCL